MSGFGPWAGEISPAERLARLRSLRAMALLHCHSSAAFIESLRKAETDVSVLPIALAELEKLPALRRRHLLASYCQLIGGS
jgi:hypothetical protein